MTNIEIFVIKNKHYSVLFISLITMIKDTINYIPMTHNEYYETPECTVLELSFKENCMNTASTEDMNLGGEYNI